LAVHHSGRARSQRCRTVPKGKPLREEHSSPALAITQRCEVVRLMQRQHLSLELAIPLPADVPHIPPAIALFDMLGVNWTIQLEILSGQFTSRSLQQLKIASKCLV